MANKKYGMIIDVAKCTGCCNCFLACKDENCNEEHPGYTAAQPMTGQKWMDVKEIERGTFPKVNIRSIPMTCAHCDNPGCFKQAQDGAVYKRPDGIVIIDPEKAKGQKAIVNTCPYRRVFWNEALQLPQKCDMCAHLLDKGYEMPRCVELCPTGALTFGDFNDPESEVSKLMEKNPQPLMPKFGLKDSVLYLNYPKNFIAGSVVYGDTDQCGEGATVTLKGEGIERTLTADNYGDFWFEDLETNLPFTVTVEREGYETVVLETRTLKSVNLGDIVLARK